jgi:putative membrane protein
MMGAADAVPGVSGGTVAFISGIYQELIQTLSKLGPQALQVLFKQGLSAFCLYINGNFLSTLLSGMLCSIALLSNLVLYLLAQYPQMIWGFFFGLICASTIVLAKSIDSWNISSISVFVVGGITSYLLTTITASVLEPNFLNVFFAGMLAICAMILPGISGSFILLLLGMYSYILSAIQSFDVLILMVFVAGCVAGLLCFSKLLNCLFDRFKNITMALLTGILLGSLNKVWPWKETLTTRINSNGEQVADQQQNISPFIYQQMTGSDSYVLSACVFALVGAGLVLILEKVNR